jgi:hypothetical protein
MITMQAIHKQAVKMKSKKDLLIRLSVQAWEELQQDAEFKLSSLSIKGNVEDGSFDLYNAHFEVEPKLDAVTVLLTNAEREIYII